MFSVAILGGLPDRFTPRKNSHVAWTSIVGRCISYCIVAFLGDILVFRGVLSLHFYEAIEVGLMMNSSDQVPGHLLYLWRWAYGVSKEPCWRETLWHSFLLFCDGNNGRKLPKATVCLLFFWGGQPSNKSIFPYYLQSSKKIKYSILTLNPPLKRHNWTEINKSQSHSGQIKSFWMVGNRINQFQHLTFLGRQAKTREPMGRAGREGR